MGCGAGKEAADPEVPPNPKGHAAAKDPDDEPDDGRPPLRLEDIRELWTAGAHRTNVAPWFISHVAGPWARHERVPAAPEAVQGRIVRSATKPPPRFAIDAELKGANDELPAASADGAAVAAPSPAAGADMVDLADTNAGLYLRAYLPHSLTGYCVGWCRPDAPRSSLVAGFMYDADVNGLDDVRAIRRRRGPKRDLNARRRLLLFPQWLDAVGLYVKIRPEKVEPAEPGMRCLVSRSVAPLTRQCDASNTEPMDGAFATYSIVASRGSSGHGASSPSSQGSGPGAPGSSRHRSATGEIQAAALSPAPLTWTENSIAFTLLPSNAPNASDDETVNELQRRLDDASDSASSPHHRGESADHGKQTGAKFDVAHRQIASAFAKKLADLRDGSYTVELSMRFRYETDELTATFDKPPPNSNAGTRVVGTYRPHGATSSSNSATSEIIAQSSFCVVINGAARIRLATAYTDE